MAENFTIKDFNHIIKKIVSNHIGTDLALAQKIRHDGYELASCWTDHTFSIPPIGEFVEAVKSEKENVKPEDLILLLKKNVVGLSEYNVQNKSCGWPERDHAFNSVLLLFEQMELQEF